MNDTYSTSTDTYMIEYFSHVHSILTKRSNNLDIEILNLKFLTVSMIINCSQHIENGNQF